MKPLTPLAISLAIILPAICIPAFAGVPREWDADVAHPATHQDSAYQGETLELAARLVRGRVPFAIPAGATAGLWWKTNGMERYWGPAPAEVSTNGVVSAVWSPTNDVGASAYRGFLGVSLSGDGSNIAYAANFTLRMLESPGCAPNTLPLPVKSLDFSTVAVSNAPWIETETDPTVPEWAKSPTPPAIPPETDPAWSAWADTHTNRLGNVEEADHAGVADRAGFANDAGSAGGYAIGGGIDLAIRGAAQSATNYTDSSVATRLSRAEAVDGFTVWATDDLPEGWSLASFEWNESTGRWEYRVANPEGMLFSESVSGYSAFVTNVSCYVQVAEGVEIDFFVTRTRLRPTPAMEAAWDAKLDDSDLSGYATSADLAAVEASASLVGLLLQGSNVVAEVTNYNSRVHAPTLRLLQLSESNEYYQVWAETNGLARTLAGAIEHADGATNALDAAKADRAWSHHTSGLGADAPNGYTWMSTPNTVLAGGLEFEKHVTTGGAIWILKSNGMSADFHAQTNNTAFLDLSSADGTPVFRVEKTDSYLVGVDVTSLSVSGDTLICGVNAIATEHPLARVRPSLSTGDWIKEEDGIPASLATVQWSGSSGAWVCEITNNSGGNSFFATMEYLQEGGTKIINSAPLDVSQGILCTDGVHRVRPVYSNGSVTWQVMQ